MPSLQAVSALAGARDDSSALVFEIPGLRIEEQRFLGTFSLRAVRGMVGAAAELGTLLGLTLTERANWWEESNGLRAVWSEPGAWVVFGPAGLLQTLSRKLEDSPLAVSAMMSDLSSGRVTFKISGARAVDIIASGCPIDLHPRAFRKGQSARSLLGEFAILLLKLDDSAYTITCERPFASTVSDWLIDAARVGTL